MPPPPAPGALTFVYGSARRGDHVRRRLDQLEEDALAAEGECASPLGWMKQTS